MPYCPNCDMEFIDGITTCSDCGEPLVASKEFAEAVKRQELEEERSRQQTELEAMAEGSTLFDESEGEETGTSYLGIPGNKMKRSSEASRVYIKKSQQYEDLKSSASAFLLVGGAILIFSILCWMNVVKLPMVGVSRIISQSVGTLMGIGSLIVAVTSAKSAKAVSGQVQEEETATRELIQWFLSHHTGDELDARILSESGDLVPEERSLKRFELIQDILITSHDIVDPAYVDLLAEEIYGNIYGDE